MRKRECTKTTDGPAEHSSRVNPSVHTRRGPAETKATLITKSLLFIIFWTRFPHEIYINEIRKIIKLRRARRFPLAPLALSLLLLLSILLPLASATLKSSAVQKSERDTQQQVAKPNNLHQWGAVTLFHGLPSDRVRAVAQTPDGALWFGTDNGLAKYDGRRTEAITARGLTGARVLALRVDAEGSLWIGTEDGATRLVGRDLIPVRETEGRTITAIITPERGRAVLASLEGRIFDCRTQPDGSLAVRTIPDEPLLSADENRTRALPLTSLAATAGGDILVGSRSRGLLAVNSQGVKAIESRPRPFFVEALEIDEEGNLWMGARVKKEDSGLYYARDTARPAKLGETLGTVTALGADREGGVWVGTDGRGVFRFNAGAERERFTFENTSGGLRSNTVYSVFVDRERVVWFGTDKGVCRYDAHALRVENVNDVQESNFVRSLYRASDGRIMCGTTRGLFILDQAASVWRPVQRFARSTVYAIAEDRAGRLLVGTSGGLYASTLAAPEVAGDTEFTTVEGETLEGSTSDSVRSIARFQNAVYVASYGRGVERVEGSRRAGLWPSGAGGTREVVSLYAEGGESLWIGTAGGEVLRFNGRETGAVGGLEALKGSAVWDVQGNTNGLVWIASAKGLYVLRGGALVNVVPGVDARRILVIKDERQEQAVYCATAGAGLLKVLITEGFGPVISRLDIEQGLPSQSAFAVLPPPQETAYGSLLIGTSRGLARYEPGRVAPALSATRVSSSRVHQPEELGSGLRLEYPQNSLVVDVAAASSRTFPEQFQYGFILYDEKGRLIRQKLSRESQLVMEGLKPGRYRVEARAYNIDLISSEPVGFEFVVAGSPFPWTTAALAVLLALALVALSWGYFQNRRIARTSGELMEANRDLADARLAVANQAERERRRIARDLHDQTLADLRNLILLTDQLPAAPADNGHAKLEPATFRAEIEAISTEIRRICEDLSPSVLENVGLSAALEWALSNGVAHAPAECRFEYEFKCEEDLEERIHLAPGERMQIYRIAQEAINNICRHANPTRVRLEVGITEDGGLLVELEDDGREFDPSDGKRKQGRGLANIRARASLIEAEVSWTRRDEGSTLFTLRKPGHPVEQGV